LKSNFTCRHRRHRRGCPAGHCRGAFAASLSKAAPCRYRCAFETRIQVMTFDDFIAQGWQDHADDAAGVAARLQAEGPARVENEAQIVPLAALAQHVFGDHLGHWQAGIDFQHGLARLPVFDPDGASGQAVRRLVASLALAGGSDDHRDALGASDRVRVSALAAGSLAGRDAPRAAELLQQALAGVDAHVLPGTDPAIRTLAAVANNVACALELKSPRSAAERATMILAAQTARRYWEQAGSWLEVERAEYRLAMTWLQAGDPLLARRHAQQCLELVQANAGPALELFYAWEALGVVDRAAGNANGHATALAQARVAYAALDAGDRGGCQVELDKLAAGSP
jgi:hypothetical protein